MRKLRKILLLLCFWLAFIQMPKAIYTVSTPMKCVLDRVSSAVVNYQDNVDVKDCRLSTSEMKNYFWSGAIGYPFRELIQSFTYRYSTSYVDSLSIQYRYSMDSTIQIQKDYKTIKNELMNQLDTSMSDLDKLFYLYNYLALYSEYDLEAAKIENSFQDSKYALSFSMFGPLYYGKAVCSGYSQSYLDLVKQLGMEAHYLTSTKMNHGWNLVKYNNQWYHIDVTYGDPVPDRKGYVDYRYFLMNDSEIAMDHTWEDKTIVSNSTVFMDSKYIFNQPISDANYVNGKWYYLDNGSVYASQIDSTDKELILEAGNIKDLFIKENKMYYTTSNDGYYLNAIYETNLELGYNVQLTTLKNASYVEGLFVEDGKAYVNTRTGEKHFFDVNLSSTLESYLSTFTIENDTIAGEVVLTFQYYNTLFEPTNEAELLFKGETYTIGVPLTKMGSSIYSFTIPVTDLFNDTYKLQIEYDGKKYDMSAVLGDFIAYEDLNGVKVSYEQGVLSVAGLESEKVEDFDYSSYGNGLFPIYTNSRVTHMKMTSPTTLHVAGYALEQFNSYSKKDTFVRELVLIEMETGKEYRVSLPGIYNPYLNGNATLNPMGEYDYSYAFYDSYIDLRKVYTYWDKELVELPKGTYRLFIRLSDGVRSNVFPLQNIKDEEVVLENPFFKIENSNDVAMMY